MSLILQDRLTLTNVSIEIDDGQLKLVDTTDSAVSEPILNDTIDDDIYWKLFIYDGQLAIESTDDFGQVYVELYDETLKFNWRLQIDSGQITYTNGAIRKIVPKIMLIKIAEYIPLQIFIEGSLCE